MRILKPKSLKAGDVIGLIAPASSTSDFTRIEKGVKYLESLNYRVELGQHIQEETGYLAGNDSQRAEDINNMFKNKNVNAIFCVRGGYGSGRILDQLDYQVIKKNPKILVGYSDITALQLAILKKTGLVSFAGPMVAVDFADEIDSFTEETFWRTITSTKKIGKILNPDNEKLFTLSKGRAEGNLIGGNLTLLLSLFGTEYLPALKDSILFFEEINEPPYKIDRMFNQLRLSKVLESVKGILLGRFVDCYETDTSKSTLSLNDVIVDYFGKLKKPVIYNLKHGHIKKNLTLPIGISCKVNSQKGFIEVMESAVK